MAADLKHAFTGRHLVNRRLTGPTSNKDTRHQEIAIEGTPVEYLPGDALGANPSNDPALVDRILRAIGATGNEPVTTADGVSLPVGQALSTIYNLTTPSRRLLELMAARGATTLAPLLDKANAEQLKHYVSGWNDTHDVLDVLEDYPHARLSADELVETLRKTLPRLYSVASSPKVQHRLRDQARDVWAWLEDGAEIFVCGDKERMASDVDRELHRIVEVEGGKSPEDAHASIDALKQTKRYKRDVY